MLGEKKGDAHGAARLLFCQRQSPRRGEHLGYRQGSSQGWSCKSRRGQHGFCHGTVQQLSERNSEIYLPCCAFNKTH